VLCFCAAIIEGIDLQSMGIAAAGIASEFHLTKEALGSVLTASPLGLFFGAFLGGRSADLWGRRNALILSIVVFGVFQLATPWAPGNCGLAAIRFLCGVGLGGALPNLIALTAEASGGRNNILNVVITAAGMPTGGAVAAGPQPIEIKSKAPRPSPKKRRTSGRLCISKADTDEPPEGSTTRSRTAK